MDHLSRSSLNTYTAQPLDRSAHGRKDPAWLAAQLANSQSQYLILDGHKVVTENRSPVMLSHSQFQLLPAQGQSGGGGSQRARHAGVARACGGAGADGYHLGSAGGPIDVG